MPTECRWTRRRKFIAQRGNFRLLKGCRPRTAADLNQMGGSCCFSSHQEQSQGFPSCCDPAPEPWKVCASQWRWTGTVTSTWPKATVCWMRHMELLSLPGVTQPSRKNKNKAQGSQLLPLVWICCYTSVKACTFRLSCNNLNKMVCTRLFTTAMKQTGNY